MYGGVICLHSSMDCNDWKCCGAGVMECLCLRKTYCLAPGDAEPRSCGVCVQDPTQGEICKIGVYCCDWALIQPRLLCGIARQCWCCYEAGSLPFHKDYLKEPVCALYFLSCMPEFGCCVKPPHSPALNALFTNPYMQSTAAEHMDDRDMGAEEEGGAEMTGGGYRDNVDEVGADKKS